MKACFKPVILSLSLAFVFFPEIAFSLPRAYIANTADGTVSVIDTNSRTVIDTITVGANPTHLAVNEQGTRAYVRNGQAVSVIDTSSNTVIASPSIPGGALFLNADGTRLFSHDGWFGNIYTVDTANYSVLATNTTQSPNLLRGFAVNRQGNFAYISEAVCCAGVLGLDLVSNNWIGVTTTGYGPQALVLNRSGTLLYVINAFENTLSVVNAFTFASTAKIPFFSGAYASEIAINPDGSRIYIASGVQNSVTVIDTISKTVAATIALESGPSGLTVNPADNSLYVTMPDANSVAVIDANTNAVVATIPVGNNPVSTGVFIAQHASVNQQANLAIRARGATSATVGFSTKINIVMDNYGPDPAVNPSVLIETNAPGSSMYAAISYGWTCMQNAGAKKASFICAAYGNMPVGIRPSIVLRFIAPGSMASNKLMVTAQISSESGDKNLLNNTNHFLMSVDANRGIKPPITSPSANANKR